MSGIAAAALVPIVAILAISFACIFRFFTETTAKRMARLTGDAKKRSTSIDTGDDPHSLGRIMESTGRNLGALLSGCGTSADGTSSDGSGSDGSGCGAGGSGE
jgi:hypothetical protein